jgi:hypothetical protein
MFTKENGIRFVTMLAAVMVGVAAHQIYVAKHAQKLSTKA